MVPPCKNTVSVVGTLDTWMIWVKDILAESVDPWKVCWAEAPETAFPCCLKNRLAVRGNFAFAAGEIVP